jgi:hypothetical protein
MNKRLEKSLQDEVKKYYESLGYVLWRNNVGALKTPYGGFLRFGLANESQKMNAALKSSDLVGIKPLLITQDHVGQLLGQFVAFEIKKPGWKFRETPKELAQKRFIDLVNEHGGYAQFVSKI